MEYWYEQLEVCGHEAEVTELRGLLPSKFWVRVKELIEAATERESGMRLCHDFDHPMTARESDAYKRHVRYLEVLHGITCENKSARTLAY